MKYICRISYDDYFYSLMLEKWEDAHILMDRICEEHDITYKDIYHGSDGRGLEYYPVTEGIQSNLGMWDEESSDIPSPDDVEIYFFSWEVFFYIIGMKPIMPTRKEYLEEINTCWEDRLEKRRKENELACDEHDKEFERSLLDFDKNLSQN